jgi:hypothetical protein
VTLSIEGFGATAADYIRIENAKEFGVGMHFTGGRPLVRAALWLGNEKSAARTSWH